MITKTFAIHDAKAKMFQLPFYMLTVGMALRAFEDLCRDKNSLVSKHPEDFILYEIGTYDDSTAEHNNNTPISFVASANEYAKSTKIEPILTPVETNNKEPVK